MPDRCTFDDGTTLLEVERGACGVSPQIFENEAALFYCALPDAPALPDLPEHSRFYDEWDAVCSETDDPPMCVGFGTGQSVDEFLSNEGYEDLPITCSDRTTELPPSREMVRRLESLRPESAAAASHQAARNSETQMCMSETLPIVLFGRVHEVPFEEWESSGQLWQERLFAEAEMLIRSLEMDAETVREFDDESWFCEGVSYALASLKALLPSSTLPKEVSPQAYQDLIRRVENAIASGLSESPASWPKCYESGLEFQRVRAEQERLNLQFADYRNKIIGGAEAATGGLEVIETGAFLTLDLAAQAYAFGDPIREAAYRLSIAMIHAGARSLGEYSSGRESRRVLKALGTQLRKDAPGILADCTFKLFMKGSSIPSGGPKDRIEGALEEIIKALFGAIFDILDFALFEIPFVPEKEKANRIAEFLETSLHKMIKDAVLGMLVAVAFNIQDDEKSELKKLAATLAEEIVKDLYDEIIKAHKVAKKDPNKDTMDVLLSVLPMLLAACVAKSVMKVSGKKRINAKMQSDLKDNSTTKVFGIEARFKDRVEIKDVKTGEVRYEGSLEVKRVRSEKGQAVDGPTVAKAPRPAIIARKQYISSKERMKRRRRSKISSESRRKNRPSKNK